MTTTSIEARILAQPHRFLYPASLYRLIAGEPGVLIRKALEGLVATGELEPWEVPSYRNRLMEDDARPGTGHRFEGLLDDALDEIEPDMVTPVVAYRRRGA